MQTFVWSQEMSQQDIISLDRVEVSGASLASNCLIVATTYLILGIQLT